MVSARTVAVYIRVSTEDQAASGLGLEDQRTRCLAYVAALGIGEGCNVRVFEDAGVSAKTLDRPALSELLALVKRRQIAAVVVLKLDRITRKLGDLLALVDNFEAFKVAFHSVTERVDTGSAAGRMLLGVLGSVSQWEREIISERTRSAVRAKRARGEAHGFEPLGAVSVRGRFEAVRGEVEAINRMHEMRASGASFHAIAAALKAQGFETKRGGQWHGRTVKAVLDRVKRDGFVAGVAA